MKTIEERAKEYASTPLPTSKVRELRVIDYTKGATEQKKIDIEKAWSILKELIDDNANDGYCEKHIITQEQFREAMEDNL